MFKVSCVCVNIWNVKPYWDKSSKPILKLIKDLSFFSNSIFILLSTTQKEVIDNKMKNEFETKLKALINIRHKDYGGWVSLAEYYIGFYGFSEPSSGEDYDYYLELRPSKYIPGYYKVMYDIPILNYHTDLKSYKFTKYRALLTVCKKPNMNSTSPIKINKSTTFFADTDGIFIYLKDLKIINRNPITVLQELTGFSIQNNISTTSLNYIITIDQGNSGFVFHNNKVYKLFDLTLDISLPADFSSKITTEKNKIMEDRIITSKDA
jgi:hypothetical protein